MQNEEKSAVDVLEGELYSRSTMSHVVDATAVDKRSSLNKEEFDAPVAWSKGQYTETPKPMTRKKSFSLTTKFFMSSIAFFIASLSVAIYLYLGDGNTISPQNIDMQIILPSLVDSGKATTFQVLIDNRNTVKLQLVDLVINYPDGTRVSSKPTQALAHERQSIGTIESGEQVNRTASAIFYGQEGAQQNLKATLEYTIVGSNAIFEKKAEIGFIIGSSPVSMIIESPSDIVSQQSFIMDVMVRNNTTAQIDNVVIQGQYPFGFSVLSTEPSAMVGNTLWRLGTLKPGATQVIHIVGTIDGQEGDQRVFRFLAGSDADQTNTQIKVPILTVPQTLKVRRPFITASLAVNGQTGKTATLSAGREYRGVVSWKNTLPVTLHDAQIKLSLVGAPLDVNSITSTNGFYQSSDISIVWSKDQVRDLENVPAGGSGTLEFLFSALPPSAGSVVYTNPVIDLNVTISGVQKAGGGYEGTPETITSAAVMRVMFTSVASLTAKATHFTGIFTNTGSMPPVADHPTTYTITWSVNNSSNALAQAKVSAVLPSYITFMTAESGKSVSGGDITYNANNRTVTWNIGDVQAGVGYSTTTISKSFQISFLPSTSHFGQSPGLTGIATLRGQDRFTQEAVQSTSPNIPTTKLSDDTGFQTEMGVVQKK